MQEPTNFSLTVPPQVAMEILIDRHGTFATIHALFMACCGAGRRRRVLAGMSRRIRRDAGLPRRGPRPLDINEPWS